MCPEPRLLPDAQPAIAAYLVCHTQWRVGMNGRTGLDNSAVLATLGAYLPRWQHQQPDVFASLELPDLMSGVQTIEAAMLTGDHERREARASAGDRID